MLFQTLFDWLRLAWTSVPPVSPALVTSFFSVLIGALPFIVVAAFASAALEVFVDRDALARLIPKNGVLGVLFAPIVGLLVPLCECGIVPVARRMVQKGVPGSAAITFMLANPILNPLSVYSTYLAFPYARSMVLWRIGLGYVVAVLIGLMIHRGMGNFQARRILLGTAEAEVAAAAEPLQRPMGERIQAFLDHAAHEFFDVLKYFVMGSAIAAVSQQLISRQALEAVGGGPVVSVLVMIVFAFVICICSEADAFVAATFASTFTPGALLAFLVAGPMTDIKNTIMMMASFRRGFVIFLNIAIITLTALSTIGLNLWLLRGGM